MLLNVNRELDYLVVVFEWLWKKARAGELPPGLLTLAMAHYNQTVLILEQRQALLDAAYQIHPERFVRRAPRPPLVPTEAWINNPVQQT